MKTALLLVLSAALVATGARAAPLERDLGSGLVYFRAHVLPEDLPGPGSVGPHPCVLDLRYVRGGNAEGAALLGWLKRQAGVRTPVFLLANADTSGPLLAPLNSPDSVIGLVIIGPASPGFSPDIGLSVSPKDERRAYDAMEKGATIESLLNERVIKSRNDEATLARSRLSDSDSGEPEAAPAAAPAARPPPLIDAVLQRAVQLHRSLLALKRI
jgi:hypothetical protein